jgi:hypothetical protein
MGSFLMLALAALFAFCSAGSAFAYAFPGDGTESDPFQIDDAADLDELSYLVNDAAENPTYAPAYYILSNDVTFDPSVLGPWIPIGVSERLAFSGAFDGNNKTISGLSSIDVTEDYQGLFGYISGARGPASVKDLTFVEVNIAGSGRYVGTVAGYASSANIENCVVSSGVVSSDYAISEVGGIVGNAVQNTVIVECENDAAVDGTGYRVGGIAGYISSSAVLSSDNRGVVTGVVRVGGIVGYASTDFEIEGCNNFSEVTGARDYTGGIVGYAYYRGVIENCRNTGVVTGSYYIGGIAGYADTGNNITECYNAAVVTGGDNAGGIAGGIFNQSTIEFCLNDIEATVSGNGE